MRSSTVFSELEMLTFGTTCYDFSQYYSNIVKYDFITKRKSTNVNTLLQIYYFNFHDNSKEKDVF